MKVYRVHHSYHETSESGTKEHGIYSTEEKARERAVEVAQKISDTEITIGDGYVSFGSWYTTYIYWNKYDVDEDIDMDFNGYT